jgi:hypothetical protein
MLGHIDGVPIWLQTAGVAATIMAAGFASVSAVAAWRSGKTSASIVEMLPRH